MKYLIHSRTLFVLILTLVKARAIIKDCKITDNNEVHVINKLPNPRLKLHCASGDDELGYFYTGTNYDFNWSFCDRWDGRTLYFCHFWWGGKEIAFDVYQHKIKDKCNGKKGPIQCFWEARSDGIYFSGAKEPGKYEKVHDWKDI